MLVMHQKSRLRWLLSSVLCLLYAILRARHGAAVFTHELVLEDPSHLLLSHGQFVHGEGCRMATAAAVGDQVGVVFIITQPLVKLGR